MFYDDAFDVQILYSSNHIIDVQAVIKGEIVFMSFVYGDPVVGLRDYVWEKLTRIGFNRYEQWLMIDDFNEITENHEKNERMRPAASFLPFKTMITNCGMLDFSYIGNPLS